MMIKQSMAALTLASLTPMTALAQQTPAPGLLHFDSNGDGVISRSEYDNANAQRFAQIDANHDGALALLEQSVSPAQASAAMTQLDFDAAHAVVFASLDRNTNGQIDLGELPGARLPQ